MADPAQSDTVPSMNPLDLALAHAPGTRRHVATNGDIDLAIAWGQGRVTTSQAAVGFGFAKTKLSVYSRLALAFREGIRSGRIKA